MKSRVGGSLAMPSRSTLSAAHAFLARVGPRSGPPCLCEPPTTVGAISLACARQAFAPFQPFSAIRSYRVSPTVFGWVPTGCGHEKCSLMSFRTTTNTTLGRNCGTPKSEAFISFQPGSYPSFVALRQRSPGSPQKRHRGCPGRSQASLPGAGFRPQDE